MEKLLAFDTISFVKPNPHSHLKFKFGISGGAETGHCSPDALDRAKLLGKYITEMEGILLNGATTGFPYWAAIGAKEAGGFTIGISPAASEREHAKVYGLPLDYMDIIIYTGAGYSGRDILLTHSSDAIVLGCGRIGTLHEFTVAFEDRKPIGVLTETGGTTEMLDEIIKISHRAADNPNVIFDSDPRRLLDRLAGLVKKRQTEYSLVE